MNDTEAEARRLFAAATDDMPPGIDLLAGFAAARRRDRTRRTWGRVGLSAGAAAAACATAVALTIGSAPPALATVTSALTTTLTRSYHFTEVTNWSSDGRITGPPATCTGETDPVRNLSSSVCGPGPAYANGQRVVGGYAYLYVADPQGYPGKHWDRMPAACLPNQSEISKLSKIAINGFTVATPQQMLSEIKQTNTVTVVGPASGPGWTGTRYAFTGTVQPVSGTVDVDQQGQARNLVLTIRPSRGSVWTEALTFSDFGAPVTVTPPPPDQTFTPPRCF
jgi:hypothetical protein